MYENCPRDSGLDKEDSNPSPKRQPSPAWLGASSPQIATARCRPSVFSSISTPYPRWTEFWPENGYCRRLGGNLVSPPMSPKSVSLVTDSGTSERRPRDRPLLHVQGGYSDSMASLKTWNGFPRSPVPGWGTRVPNFQTTANRGCPPLSRCTQSEVPRCLSQGDGYLENISQPISK